MPGKVISKTSADATMTQPVSALSMAVNGTISMHSPCLFALTKKEAGSMPVPCRSVSLHDDSRRAFSSKSSSSLHMNHGLQLVLGAEPVMLDKVHRCCTDS
jgi:hypothetical protein